MSMPYGEISVVTPRAILRECAGQGVRAPEVLAALNIAPGALSDHDFRVPLEKVLLLWQEAERRTGDENVALHASEHLGMGAYGMFDYLIFTSAAIPEALGRACSFYPLVNSSTLRLSVEQCHEGVVLVFYCTDSTAEIPRAYADYVLTAILLRLRHATGRQVMPSRVSFASPPPRDLHEHTRIFGNGVRFRQPHHQIVFAEDSSRLRFTLADQGLAEVLEQYAHTVLRGALNSNGILASVRQVVAEDLRAGAVSVHHAAGRLHLSPRTLQRRLAEQGVSFRQILDEVRWDHCRRLLGEQSATTNDITEELRFSEPRAFYRAFRRWTGTTLGHYRRFALN